MSTSALTLARALLDDLTNLVPHVDPGMRDSLEYVIGERQADLDRVEGRREYYTTAPEAYDGFGTRTVPRDGEDWVDNRGESWRRVSVLPAQHAWQEGRNASGLHPLIPATTFREEWVGGSLVRARPPAALAGGGGG